MVSEKAVKQGFSRVKEDVEGIKDELAFALKRIAKLESSAFNIKLEKPKRKK